MVKNVLPLIIVGLFTFIAGFSLLHKGLPPTHDGEYHVVRFYEFDRSLRDGNWYPRWAADLNSGYGVPLFNYVYPLPNYVASFFHFLGFSFIDAFKLNMFFALILGSIFFYLWAKGFWGVWGGLVGSIFYTFSPYHFVDIYIRGSVGEIWALAFFPAFLWSVTEFLLNRKRIFVIFSSVFLALIIFSHNILALMFFVFSLFYIIVLICQQRNRKFIIVNSLFIILIGLGLSAIFWLPAFIEAKYVTGLQIYNVLQHFPQFYQLIIPSWGSGFSGEGLGSSVSFQIGVANLLGVFLGLLLFFIYRKKNKNSTIVLFFTFLFFSIFFLMLKASLPIWKNAPFMNYFQFPWRFLSLEILIASFLVGSIVQYFSLTKLKMARVIVGLCLILLAFSLGVGYAKPAHYLYRDDNYYISRSNFIDGTNSPGNFFNTIWMNRNLTKEKEKIKFAKGEGKVNTLSIKSSHYKFNVFAQQPSEVVTHTAYFPGWTVFIDQKVEKVRYNKDGLITFSVASGEHLVDVILLDTTVRKLASLVTILSILYSIVACSMSLGRVLWRK